MYWTLDSIPELKGLSHDVQIRLWRRNEGIRRNGFACSFLTILLWVVIALPFISIFDSLLNYTPQRNLLLFIPFLVPVTFIAALLRFQLQVEERRPLLRDDMETCCRLCGCQHGDTHDGSTNVGCERAILADSSPKRRVFFRINLSTLFTITTVFCFFFFYVNQQLSNYELQQGIVSQLKAKQNCSVIPTYRIGPLLDSPYGKVVFLQLHGSISDADLEALEQLPSLEMLFLEGTQITDASLNVFATLSNLKFLNLRNTLFTEEGIASLKHVLPKATILNDFPVVVPDETTIPGEASQGQGSR